MKKNVNVTLYLLTLILSVLVIFIGWQLVQKNLPDIKTEPVEGMETAIVKVLEVTDEKQEVSALGEMYYLQRSITFDGKVIKGPRKGEIIAATQTIDNVSTMGVIPVEKGDRIFIHSSQEEPGSWYAGDYYRSNKIFVLGCLFCLGLVLFGRKKGINTLLSLALTCLIIFAVFVPSIPAGFSPYITAPLVCIYIIIMTLGLVSGFNIKSFASALGCMGGILAAGLLTVFMGWFMKLTGFVDDNALYVYLLNPDKPINLKSVIFAANIIGALGAVMDVSMSISSSLHEISQKLPDISFHSLFGSGVHIGQDILGTMANTLILAYIGSSLSIVLLFISYQDSLIQLLNRELMIVEMLQALTGSIGILLTVPISALVASFLYTIGRRRKTKEVISQQ